jgi:hypothetical protein
MSALVPAKVGRAERAAALLLRHRPRTETSHMVEEYARHNGHADLRRERIDGRIGE